MKTLDFQLTFDGRIHDQPASSVKEHSIEGMNQ